MPLDTPANRDYRRPRPRFSNQVSESWYKLAEYTCYGMPYRSCFGWAEGEVCASCLAGWQKRQEAMAHCADCPQSGQLGCDPTCAHWPADLRQE